MTRFRGTAAAAIASLSLIALVATPSLAADRPDAGTAPEQLAHTGQHRGGEYAGRPCPRGMMGHGMGHHGMMGQGMMGHHGMMGQGMMRPGFGGTVLPGMDLTTDDVRHVLEHRLSMQGNPRLKVGEIEQADDDTIVADIATAEGALVDRFRIDRHNGRMQRVN